MQFHFDTKATLKLFNYEYMIIRSNLLFNSPVQTTLFICFKIYLRKLLTEMLFLLCHYIFLKLPVLKIITNIIPLLILHETESILEKYLKLAC